MEKIYKLAFLFLAITFQSCIPLKSNYCDFFKSGEFRLKSKLDRGLYYTIIRHDSTQIETNNKTGEITKAKITWNSQCEYEVLYQKQSSDSSNAINTFLQTRPLKVKIIKATKDYCVFDAHIDSVSINYIDTLWRVKH